jgi:diacylglycerol O-acyltransferase
LERLSGFSAWLLYSETPTAHQHTLKIAVVSETEDHPFDIDHLRRRMERRLHLLAPMRYKLAEVPLGLHHPMWLENSEVDLQYHVREVVAAAPGGKRELEEEISRIVSVPLDRSRPLWEMHVVTGLADGRIALVTKMHHALADGLASANLLARAVMNYPDEVLAEYTPVDPDPVPSKGEVLRWAAADHATHLRALPGLVRRTVTGIRRLRAEAPTPPPDSAKVLSPVTIFTNGALTADRRFTTATVSLDAVKDIRKVLGVTLNDVILGIAAGAMRQVLLQVQGHADDPLVASVPIGVDFDPERISGNGIGAMLTSLPVQHADPVQRCRSASAAAKVSKEQARLLGTTMMNDWTEYLPPRPFAWYARRASERRSADRAATRMNVVVSNVPGPKEQIHIAGYPVTGLFSVGPLYDGCGLNITVWSYRDQLNAGVLSATNLVPAPQMVTEAFTSAFEELRDAVAALGEKAVPSTSSDESAPS